MRGLAALPAKRGCTLAIRKRERCAMKVFWVIVVLWASPSETHEMTAYGPRGHYPTKEACLVAAGEEALKLWRMMYVATRSEARLGVVVPHEPPKKKIEKVEPCDRNGRHPSGDPMKTCEGFMRL